MFLEVLDNNISYVLILLGFLLVLVFAIQLALLSKFRRINQRYKDFMRGNTRANIEDHLFSYADNVHKVETYLNEIKHTQDDLVNSFRKCIQNIGLVRFDAYDNIGGRLSFALALLDNAANGVVLTGIYGRNDTRVYAKPVLHGKSDYPLSDEEQNAIEQAINRN